MRTENNKESDDADDDETTEAGIETKAIEKTTKNQDVKYKTKEAGGLDKKAAELTTDIEGVKSELAQALSMLESHCRRGELLTRRFVNLLPRRRRLMLCLRN